MINSIPCCPLTSKSTDMFVWNCFGQFLLVKVLDRSIFLDLCILNDFFTAVILYDLRKPLFEDKNVLMYLFITNMQLFDSQDINWWNGVFNYLWIIDMFLSAVWTLILTAPIHWRGSFGGQGNAKLKKKNVQWRNKLIYILNDLFLGWTSPWKLLPQSFMPQSNI